jgi:hypothetical protein
MKRWLLRVLVVFGVLMAALFVAGWLANEPRPVGAPGEAADALARKIEEKVGKEAWDRTGAVWWSFGDRYVHLWDRSRSFARVRWKDVEVLLDLSTRKGLATKAGGRVEGAEGDELVAHAYQRWINDSFWLNPLVKLFDEGTTRALVKGEDGRDALLVTYSSGGSTPGDAYLWILGDDGLPEAWKMWVGILPIGGLELTWERWIELPHGARISTLHEGVFTLEMKDVQAAPSVTAVEAEDPFAPLSAQPSSRPAEEAN